MVVGEGSHLCAIVVLNRSLWNRLTSHMGLETKEANNPSNPKVRELVLGHIHSQLHTLPSNPEINSFIISDTAWSVENGLLTPTLRPRRDAIRKQFSSQISLARSEASSAAIAAIRSELANSPQIDVKDDDIPTL
jgi:long-chain acyl-CoA synthetase